MFLPFFLDFQRNFRNDDENSRSGNSVDEADLFEEFSDSLTELRVGKKLYQFWFKLIAGFELIIQFN